MGLIWTLIRRYQIRSTGRALSTKDAMLAWINTQLPTHTITNFTTDWNDGTAICALVDRIKPGLIPNHASLNKSDQLKNCTLGMNIAEEKLEIPKILDPDELCHRDVDEISVMTYISYFCTPANSHLLRWVQATIPHRNITNFTTDWNDGTNLAHLLEALNPGGFPDCKILDPHKALDNHARGMELADDQLGIKPVLKPKEMADPNVDELNIVTYLSRFQNAKPLPQPHAIACTGEGLTKAVVGKRATFEVDTSRGGSGDLLVEIQCRAKPIIADFSPKTSNKAVFVVSYVPESAGELTISVKWSGTEIPSSPYSFNILDPKSFSLTGAQITGNECAMVGKPVKMEAKGMIETSEVEVTVQLSSGETEQARIIPLSKGLAECSYIPRVVGTDKVTAKIAGIVVQGSPFKVNVIDPKKLSVTLRDPPAGKSLLISDKATIVVSASKGDIKGVKAELKSSKSAQEISLRSQGDGSLIGVVTPISIGKQEIIVTCAGENINGSPISLRVCDPSKCILQDKLPQILHVGKPYNVGLLADDAGEGTAQIKSSDIGIVDVACKPGLKNSRYDLTLIPKKVGDSTISIEWNGFSLSKTPHKVSVCDVTKCIAFGPGLTSGKGKIKEIFDFTVQVEGAGNGDLSVTPRGPKLEYTADILKKADGAYKISFTPLEVGEHTIEILWCGVSIKESPYKVDISKQIAANAFTVTGDGLKSAIALDSAKFMILGPESGLISSGLLKITINGNGKNSTIVSRRDFNPQSGKTLISVTDNLNGSYDVQYAIPKAGNYSISITSDGKDVPGSPFKVDVLPSPNAGKCFAFGPAIDNPLALVTLKPLEFKIDSTEAGTGELSITAKDKNLANIPVFLAEDHSIPGKKLHSVKIDLKAQGKYEISMQWSGKHIPKSPLTINVSDPREVIIIDLPNSAEFIGRKGEVIEFSVDTRKAGSGELKAEAKLDGKVESFSQKRNPDGTTKLSYTPKKDGKMELFLTFGGINILKSSWLIDVTDPMAFRVTPPKEHGKLNESIKFIISGMKKKELKNIKISAKNKNDATVKVEFNPEGQAIAHFKAEEVGEYTVEVKIAKKHVSGSPFQCPVANPDGCKIIGHVPTVVPINVEKQFTIDTSTSGPGDLVVECLEDDGTPSKCFSCTISGIKEKVVKIKGEGCGKALLHLKYAGFIIPSMPVEIICMDWSKCTYTCKQIENGTCRTNEDITIHIDTSNGGSCSPKLTVKGPKSTYDIHLKKLTAGRYTATLTPWQDGSNVLEVTVAGKNIPGSPKSFESLKPLDASKITISGPGLERAVANRPSEITIYARQSMLIEQGMLAVSFKDGNSSDHNLEIEDKLNGTYVVSFLPKVTGTLQLSVTGDGKDIVGSPFNINVIPEPDPSKCVIKNRSGNIVFSESSEIYHLVRTTFELAVHTTEAGTGSLTANGESPNGSQIRIFTNDEEVNGERISYIKFDPTSVGIYKLSLAWDNKELNGSPYKVFVVDPTKCTRDTFPSCVKVGDKVTYEIDTNGAGEGDIQVSSDGPLVNASVEKFKAGVFVVTLAGEKLGCASVDIKFGHLNLPGSPYAISVCDPSKCVTNLKTGVYNLNIPFKFKIMAEEAGRAKLQVISSRKGTSIIRNPEGTTWEVAFTPKEAGHHSLQIFWGNWEINGSPFSFFVCDPTKVKIEGLPDPNDVLILGKPVFFTVDDSESGQSDLSCHTITSDGTKETVEREETDTSSNITSFSFVPKNPGNVTLILEYNGVDILTKPHIYNVPDPSKFKVIPPKEYGKIKEYMKFGITGVSEETELVITATHPEHDATVKTEKGSDNSTVIARLTPKCTGEYNVEVKHMGQHIDGSPFIAQVCNPDACKFIGDIPKVIHLGEEPNIQVDSSEAGPGELTFESETISGLEDETAKSGVTSQLVIPSMGEIGRLRVTAKWAGYIIPGTPFILDFVDSQKVTWSCELLHENETIKQGELMKVILDNSEAGETSPVVTAIGPTGEEYPAKITDNNDGTHTISFNPWQVGKNEIKILWGGVPIPNTPINFEVMKNIELRTITVSGHGLKNAVAKEEAIITIDAIESGLIERDLLKVSFEGEEKDVPTSELTDEGDGLYKFSFIPPEERMYTLAVTYEDQHIPNSPFEITAKPAPDSEKCRVFGEAIEKEDALFLSNDPVKFSVDTSKAGSGSLSIVATQPDLEAIRVYTVEEGDIHHLKFDPDITGHYTVEVKWEGRDIPGSPFDFNIVDPLKCIVKGLPFEGDHVHVDEPLNITVDTKEVGDCIPQVSVIMKENPVDIEKIDKTDGIFTYNFIPKYFGKASIIVKVADTHVPSSPCNFTVVDPNKFSIIGLYPEDDYAIVCEPVTIEISGRGTGEDEILVTAHGPSADLNVDVVNKGDEIYEAKFVPIEPGSYEVFIEYAGRHVNGSPFTIRVADPSKCQILGQTPSILQLNVREEITVKTRGSGEGELKALVKNEDESNPAIKCEVKDLGLDTYSVFLTGNNIGKASIDLQWAGYTIPNSPFLIIVCDASKCRASGDVLETKKGKAGTAISFTVETEYGGEGELDVTAKGPSAQYTMNVVERKESTYDVSFTPWEIGIHKISILWGNSHIPNSPFSVNVGSPLEMEICNATGDGLKHGIAGQKTTFMIICSEVGLLDSNVLKVTVMGVTAHANVVITDNNNGCYTVEYIPPTPGAYVASVLFHDRQIPGSPFKITVDSGPDASKCKAYGPALHPNTLAIAGSPLEFFVDTTEAGYGHLRVYIQGPNDYKPKVFMADDEKGIYSIKFDAMKAGKYLVAVVWSDKHIPNSPIRIRVHPAADAGKVKASGPGLLDGFIGTPGQFYIETKNAGIGTLLIRMHGLKDSFKIEAKPISEDDPRTLLVTYNPKLVGEYVVFVRWSGVHIPGSPFNVQIKQKPGKL